MMGHRQATRHVATPLLAWLVVPVLVVAALGTLVVLAWQTRATGDPRPLLLGLLVSVPPLLFLAVGAVGGRMVHRGGSP